MCKNRKVERGDVYIADLSPVVGSEQGGCRPVVIVSNDTCNQYSPNVVCVAITSKIDGSYPTHAVLDQNFVYGTIMAEQIRTLSLKRLRKKLGRFSDMSEIDKILRISLSL